MKKHLKTMLGTALTLAVLAGPAFGEGYGDKSSQTDNSSGTMHNESHTQNMKNDDRSEMNRGTVPARDRQARWDPPTIRDVQESLQERGYNIAADGVWGPNTASAIESFQNKNDLTVTGRLDTETLAALDVDVNDQARDRNQY